MGQLWSGEILSQRVELQKKGLIDEPGRVAGSLDNHPQRPTDRLDFVFRKDMPTLCDRKTGLFFVLR